MDVESVQRALRDLEGDFESGAAIEPILGGWSFRTFRVGADHVVRFPKDDAVAAGLERELKLLPALARKLSFTVPAPVAVGRYRGRPFGVARWIHGRPISAGDVAAGVARSPEHAGEGRARVAQVLAELHGFPARQAAELMGVPRGVGDWRDRHVALRKTVAERVEPLLDAHVRDRVAAGFTRFLEEALESFAHPVLVHGDLGVEHLRVDDAGKLVGVIDFEEAAVGDPAIDFVGLQIAFGDDVVRDVLARYGGPPDSGFGERLRFYVWMGSAHAILHGLDEGDDALVADATRELSDRIEA
jgi:aminoglycoside 2''-phosphotransferase